MSGPDLRVRAAAPADLEAMYQLDVACFEAPFRFSRAAMRRFTQAAGAFSLVAEAGEGAFVGFLVVQMEGGEGYVVTLDVREGSRRRGVARMLLMAAEGAAAERGGAALGLHVWTENVGAIRFYEGGGYGRTQLHPDFYGEGKDAWGYRKELV